MDARKIFEMRFPESTDAAETTARSMIKAPLREGREEGRYQALIPRLLSRYRRALRDDPREKGGFRGALPRVRGYIDSSLSNKLCQAGVKVEQPQALYAPLTRHSLVFWAAKTDPEKILLRHSKAHNDTLERCSGHFRKSKLRGSRMER